MEDQLILVNEQDEETGTCGKLEAHEKGLLHRAFSIFIFRKILTDNPDGTGTCRNQLLLQKRAEGKYHSAGLWANSCCSHPRKGESLKDATERRLLDETGIKTGEQVKLEEAGAFIYRADFENGLTEHELDHVFTGWISTDFAGEDWPGRNPEEASEMKFEDIDVIVREARLDPKKYAAWFVPALTIALAKIGGSNGEIF